MFIKFFNKNAFLVFLICKQSKSTGIIKSNKSNQIIIFLERLLKVILLPSASVSFVTEIRGCVFTQEGHHWAILIFGQTTVAFYWEYKYIYKCF